VITYDDLNYVLKSSVLDVGPSDRHPAARKAFRNTQTKIRHGNYRPTAFEANRINFSSFKQDHRQALLAIRKDLEAVGDSVPLEKFTRNEQLAYFLNLHNVAVMSVIAEQYPLKKVKKLAIGSDSLWDNKNMMIAGVPTSIRDIEEHVVANWENPVVLYGFFMGSIGGPNIRKSAYTGANVYKALESNARRFVNSLRGFRAWSGTGRASEHYKLGMRYFPDFGNDFRQHLYKYANGATRKVIARADIIKANSYDWGIADLVNGDTYGGGSFNTSSTALAWFIFTPSPSAGISASSPTASIFSTGALSRLANGKVSPQTRALLQGIEEREQRRVRDGEVTVEEFVDEKKAPIAKPQKKEDPEKEDVEGEGAAIVLVTLR